MKKRKDMRDAGIELARILGCLIVVGVHVTLSDNDTGVYDLSRGFINCLVADGVAIFWIIAGCFLFRTTSYKKVLARTAKSIAVPMALLSIFCFYLSGWVFYGTPLLESISRTGQEHLAELKNAINLNATIPGSWHLWYCYVYLLVVFTFPVLRAFVAWLEEDVKREKWFLILSFAFLAVNDLTQNQMAAFSHHGFNAAIPAAVEMIWGHILYRHKDDFKMHAGETVWLVAAPVAFVALNLLRTFIVYKTASKAILYWYSTIGLICALCVITFCMVLVKKIRSGAVKTAINTVGSYTFLVYLIHLPVRSVFFRYSVTTRCYNWLSQSLGGIWFELAYTLVLTLALFLISMLVGAVLRGVRRMVCRLFAAVKSSVAANSC